MSGHPRGSKRSLVSVRVSKAAAPGIDTLDVGI